MSANICDLRQRTELGFFYLLNGQNGYHTNCSTYHEKMGKNMLASWKLTAEALLIMGRYGALSLLLLRTDT